MRVLVTGGSGFIGSHLVDKLVELGHEVVSYDKRLPARQTPGAWYITADIGRPDAVLKAAAGCGIVFHLAALPGVQQSLVYPRYSAETNVLGTIQVLEAAHKADAKVVYASSSSVYGGGKHEEGDALHPMSPYAASKLAGEFYCEAYRRAYNMGIAVLRYFNVYGPRQNPDSEYSAVVPRFIAALRDGMRPVIYGDGEQKRDFTYVKDVVDATTRAGFQGCNETINVGAGRSCSVNWLLETVGKLMGKSPNPVRRPTRTGDVRHSAAVIAKIAELLDWEPQYSLEEGLRETIDYYCAVS